MSITQARRLMEPEQIAAQAGQQVPTLWFPKRSEVFAEREQRLRQLAAGHPMQDYLLFAAELARAQHALLADYPEVALPESRVLRDASMAGRAPLAASTWVRDPAWRDGLKRLTTALRTRMADSPAILAALDALDSASAEHVERQADRLLNQVSLGLELSTAPFISAALQVYWTHLVSSLQARHADDRDSAFGLVDDMSRCPCCASRPVASIVRIGAETSGYRYLHCSLCSTQWHVVRIKCSHCDSTKGIGYLGLAAQEGHQPAATQVPEGAVQAETCDECGHYL
ncbi:MAG TPA: formate dehydrogenase accessory protein FdhE, partial [Burkholderiaceae bacterium]|nr:formate dehydrogenase accessory protein FdhE [Burkholderiaceae bacterium]